MIIFFGWLFYLFYNERIGKQPLIVSLLFFLFFNIYIPSKANISPATISSTTTHFIGKVISPLSVSDRKIEFTLENEAKDRLLVVKFLNDATTDHEQKQPSSVKYGASCKMTGEIELPEQSRNPGQFDYRDYLLSKGIAQQTILHSFDQITCTGSSPLHKLYELRTNIISYASVKLSEETEAWLNGLVLGDDTGIDERIIDIFQRWSLSHLLAISGLHVGLIIGLVYFILVKLNIVTKETSQLLMICFLPVYALLAGGQPSVWRASTMVLLFLIFNKVKLKLSMTDTLSIVFLVLLFFDKYIIYHVGFQLSFIVTFGLILSKQLIANTSSNFFRGLQISFISQMMILPLQINYFSIFQPLSILVNTFVVPYFSLFVIPYMFILLLLLPLPSFAIKIFDYIFIKIHGLFLLIIERIDQHFNYTFVIGDFPFLLSCIYYCLFFVMMKKLEKKNLFTSFKYGCVMTGLIICLYIKPYFSPVGTVTMLDIGQGDAFVIELPYRKGVFMVDAGSRFSFTDFQPTDNVYRQIIKPYLYSQGIQQIDAILLSHKDTDHMGSFQYIIRDFTVTQLVVSNFYELDEEELLLLDRANVQLRRMDAFQNININNHQFVVLAPFGNEGNENDNSLVLYSEIGGKNWLFTGDIGDEVERKIIRTYDNIAVDVLKVAHHGSNTSTDPEFLDAIAPSFAFIPVGINNSYGHPTDEVIQTLKDRDITIYRTDQDGAVQYYFRKNKGTFLRYLP